MTTFDGVAAVDLVDELEAEYRPDPADVRKACRSPQEIKIATRLADYLRRGSPNPYAAVAAELAVGEKVVLNFCSRIEKSLRRRRDAWVQAQLYGDVA